MSWHTKALAKRVDEILAAVEVPSVDARVRLTFQKMSYRADKFGTDGRGDITLLIRTITESEGNQDALVEPIVSAVSSSCGVSGRNWVSSGSKLLIGSR
jgi:hypothetical protein